MLSTLAHVLTVLVALLHVWFLVLEMFLWTRPLGRKVFALTEEFAVESRDLAANQGLYNGFLAAGLFWGLYLGDAAIVSCFLICIIVAGIYGAATVSPRIFLVQAVPALAALAAVCLT